MLPLLIRYGSDGLPGVPILPIYWVDALELVGDPADPPSFAVAEIDTTIFRPKYSFAPILSRPVGCSCHCASDESMFFVVRILGFSSHLLLL